MKHVICYVSYKRDNLNLEDISQLLNRWESNNEKSNIKGLLLYAEGNFIQVIEGEKEKVLELWRSIEKDSRHHSIIQILSRDIKQGAYDGFKSDIVSENDKYSFTIPNEYLEPIKGMPKEIQNTIEVMLGNFLMTRF